MRRVLAALLACLLLLAACGEAATPEGPPGADQVPEVPPEDDRDPGGWTGIDPQLVGSLSADEAAEVAAAANAFGFDLHREVAEPAGNTVTSPLSASVLLAMVAAGAGGEAADAMTEVLRLDGPRDVRFAALLADLVDSGDVTLTVANALWADEGTPFEQDYLDHAQDTFGATLEEAPLGEQATADAIDDWVTDHTEGLIEAIAEDLGLPNPRSVLVLINAVYFLGEWTERFDPEDTREAPFTLADGSAVEVPTMHRSDDGLGLEVSHQADHTLVRLPYGDDERFGMEILLPQEDVALDELLAGLDVATWQASVDDLASQRVGTLTLPRFELEWDAELNDALAALGMGPAFDGSADFTPMSPANPWLGTVVQKTYLRVDEAGTEAAAVTGGDMPTSAPPDMRIDRPFAFTVSDRETGAILFLGTVHDPRG